MTGRGSIDVQDRVETKQELNVTTPTDPDQPCSDYWLSLVAFTLTDWNLMRFFLL